MILRPKQQKRFFNLFYTLVNYANEAFDILGHPADFSADNMHYDEELRRILDRVWADGTIIDSYVAANPYGLSDGDLRAAADWKQVLQGHFLLVNHEYGYSNFMADDKVYAVMGLSQEISTMIEDTPRLVTAALLPFDGCIVYDTQLTEVPLEYLPGAAALFEEQFKSLREKGEVYRSAQALINNAVYHQEEAHQRELDEKIDEFQRARRLTDPEADMPAGMHKGSLAGTSPEEREVCIANAVDSLIDEAVDLKEALAPLMRDFARGPAKTGVWDACNLITKDNLVEMAKMDGIAAPYKLKKAELIDRLIESGGMFEALLKEQYLRLEDAELGFFMELIAQGGVMESDIMKPAPEMLLCHMPPLVCNYVDGDTITTVVPKEFVEAHALLDIDELMRRRAVIRHIMDCCAAFVGLYGIISLGDFWDLYQGYYSEDELEFEDFLRELMEGVLVSEMTYGLWYDIEGDPDFSGVAADGLGADEALMQTIYVVDPSLVGDEAEGFANSLFSDKDYGAVDEEAMAYLEELDSRRRLLLERHRLVPRKILDKDELEGFSIFEYCYAAAEVQKLRQFFDTYVPDEHSDLFFADEVLDRIILYIQANSGFEQILVFLEEEGFQISNIHFANDFLDVLKDAYNAIPRWENNGYSPLGLHAILP